MDRRPGLIHELSPPSKGSSHQVKENKMCFLIFQEEIKGHRSVTYLFAEYPRKRSLKFYINMEMRCIISKVTKIIPSLLNTSNTSPQN